MKISDMQITEWRAAIARVEAGDLHAGPDVTTLQLAALLNERTRLMEALRAVERGFQDGSIQFTRKRQSDNDPYHPANKLMCAALAKIEGRTE